MKDAEQAYAAQLQAARELHRPHMQMILSERNPDIQ
jgi:hypothetical protein